MKARYSKVSGTPLEPITVRVSSRHHVPTVGGNVMARAYRSQSQVQDTLVACQHLLTLDPDNLGALETLAQAQWFVGHYDDVIRTTSKLLKLNPWEPGYRYTRGMAHLTRGELTEAQADFVTALAQSSDDGFRSQVQHSLFAVEEWLQGRSQNGSRFGGHVESRADVN